VKLQGQEGAFEKVKGMAANKKTAQVGRKRDESLDELILDAAIDILAETGYDRMTMDMVATRAKTGKATIYRRWSSKARLVRDALVSMSSQSVELKKLPDTGTLKGDLLAILKPHSADRQQKKSQVIRGLGSFFSENQEMAEETLADIFEPLNKVNRFLMQRAQERGEVGPEADIESACEMIISMITHRTQILFQSFDKEYYEKVLDGILLPALLA
jgi:AcrR family transcriptional regulator